MKPKIFIGCSGEKIRVAEQVKTFLEPVGDCSIWSEGVFKNNVSFLDTLLKQKVISNYGLFIATKDDLLESRDDVFTVPRDNIIFEFALFLGALGKHRTILMAEKGAKLPSDISGITIQPFSLDASDALNLTVACGKVIETISETEQIEDFSLLPSTTLAIGYYNNFVRRACQGLLEGAQIKIADDLHTPSPDYKLNIIIPKQLDDDLSNLIPVISREKDLHKGEIFYTGNSRGYPLHIKIQEETFNMFDLPTTLSSISEAVRLALNESHVTRSEDRRRVEERELHNFTKVLKDLVSRNVCTRRNVQIEEYDNRT